MSRHEFTCIDGHTAGNPVRLVIEGAPALAGADMSARRVDFMARHDWIRRGLMFEPRGHDMMSGGFLCPPADARSDAAILFMETSGCLPMCGHGTIGMITFALEAGLIQPREPGRLRVEVPAGVLDVAFGREGDKVAWVRLTNVASYLAARDLEVEIPGLGRIRFDVAYGGNFYAIVEPQPAFSGLDALGAAALAGFGRALRARAREVFHPVHPLDPTIRGISHVFWADALDEQSGRGRGAVFYGEKAIDRSPCGTGTSARMAQLHATGRLATGGEFISESLISSRFIGRVEAETRVGDFPAISPSIQGFAWTTGRNRIWIDTGEPFPEGFTVI